MTRPSPVPGADAIASLQAHLHRIYGLHEGQTPDIRPFLVDDAALETLRPPGTARPSDEWVLVRESDEGLDLAVWIAPVHLHKLAQAPDTRAVVRGSLRSFCAVIEGISHFMFLVERARRAEPLTLLELEVQGEIDKFVSARLHCPEHTPALRRALFVDVTFHRGLTSEERSRYREAGRLARAWCDHLTRLPHLAAVLEAQRGFWRSPGGERMSRLRSMAA
ncbi:MAG: hypothetical protein CL927_16115 [Deltaproteobacteria bacterium]|nr:hypothetical protein [Deltaproteobacteria bacterium]HCH61224.1 hypothetical protein [Deltaproteobacteria bacterium]